MQKYEFNRLDRVKQDEAKLVKVRLINRHSGAHSFIPRIVSILFYFAYFV